MTLPLMPKATAVWLIENTGLTFAQIAEFCGLHELEVEGIADGDVATGMQGYDPIDNNQLTKEEIADGFFYHDALVPTVSDVIDDYIIKGTIYAHQQSTNKYQSIKCSIVCNKLS